jgi:hypothetical protein
VTLRFSIKSKKLKTRVSELIKFNKFGIYIYIYIYIYKTYMKYNQCVSMCMKYV